MGAVYHRRPTPYLARFDRLLPQQRDFAAAEARHGLGGVLRSLCPAVYVNQPSSVTHAEFKPTQLRRFTELGLQVPPTLVTHDAVAARTFADQYEGIVYSAASASRSPEDWWAIECNPNRQWGWLPDAPAIIPAFADILSTEGTGSS